MRPPIVLLALLALALLPTQAALAEEGLPDGRVAEMVTPASNQDADVYVPYALVPNRPARVRRRSSRFRWHPMGARLRMWRMRRRVVSLKRVRGWVISM